MSNRPHLKVVFSSSPSESSVEEGESTTSAALVAEEEGSSGDSEGVDSDVHICKTSQRVCGVYMGGPF